MLPNPSVTEPDPACSAGSAMLEIDGGPPSLGNSEFDGVRRQGFAMLRFPLSLEAAYLQHKAVEQFKRLYLNAALMAVLVNGMLISDWLMVPDQFQAAVQWKLFVFTPLMIIGLVSAKPLTGLVREWGMVLATVAMASITVMLCIRSPDALASPYLVSLTLVVMFGGAVLRMRFWHALLTDALILGMFAGALFVIPTLVWEIMIPSSLVIVSTTVFSLYGSYWLDHEERSNWLMQQHEQRLLEASAQANQRLDQLSRFDMLTDVANRRHFDEFMGLAWRRAQHSGQELAVLMMDIDYFKAYNDHYGHQAGDACLQAVAAAMKSSLRRPGDLLARFGGEEFIAVLTHTSLPLAVAAAERVRQAVEQLRQPHAGSPVTQHVTLSIGVASWSPVASHPTPLPLITAADAALYEAKSLGRNQVFAAGTQALERLKASD